MRKAVVERYVCYRCYYRILIIFVCTGVLVGGGGFQVAILVGAGYEDAARF
jgi:hypothetical protein